jgi:pyruvate formate lyase activating enzyme
MIKGFIGTSLIDYPGQISAVVFTGGCNFACPFCQNASLVLPEKLQFQPDISNTEIISKLQARAKFIDGVVITGGEPSIHGKQLIQFIKDIKQINSCTKSLLVKLDTNGSNPELLKTLIDEALIDYVAMDIKAGPKRYQEITHFQDSLKLAKESIHLLLESRIAYEFRTTVVPTLIDMEELNRIGEMINGCKLFVLQSFRPKGVIDPSFEELTPYPSSFLTEAAQTLGSTFSFLTQIRY